MNGGKNDSSVTVDVLSATFMNNVNSLDIEYVDTVNISSATFRNNNGALRHTNADTISISSATFINNTVYYGLLVDNTA